MNAVHLRHRAERRATVQGPGLLEEALDRTAERIVECGTRSETATLDAMSEATRHLRPGAAAALSDRDGSEVARLRAFGILHGVVLRDLDAHGRSWLLDRLTGSLVPRAGGQAA